MIPLSPSAPPARIHSDNLRKTKPYRMPGTFFIFDVTDDYSILNTVGQGAYGAVFSASHIPTGRTVAIKRIGLPELATSSCRASDRALRQYEFFASRALRELHILRFLKECTNREGIQLESVTTIEDILQIADVDTMDAIYMVHQLMPTDLHVVLRGGQRLGTDVVQWMLYHILRALRYLHSAGIAHRDIKPENILVNNSCDTVLCDFGLGREIIATDMTVYVETRWYRAPELIMGLSTYDEKVDIWSLGCVMAEMLMPVGQRQPLWHGVHSLNQLQLIVETLGVPADEILSEMGVSDYSALCYLKSLHQRETLASRFPDWTQVTLEIADAIPHSVLLLRSHGLHITIAEDGKKTFLFNAKDKTEMNLEGWEIPVVDGLEMRLPDGTLLKIHVLRVSVDPAALDLLEGMLTFHPGRRLSASQCLAHTFLKDFYLGDEPSCQTRYVDPVPPHHGSSSGTSFQFCHALKELLYAEMMHFQNPFTSTRPNRSSSATSHIGWTNDNELGGETRHSEKTVLKDEDEGEMMDISLGDRSLE